MLLLYKISRKTEEVMKLNKRSIIYEQKILSYESIKHCQNHDYDHQNVGRDVN